LHMFVGSMVASIGQESTLSLLSEYSAAHSPRLAAFLAVVCLAKRRRESLSIEALYAASITLTLGFGTYLIRIWH